MFCAYCGKQLDDGDVYCPSCGKKVIDNVKAESGAADRHPSELKSGRTAVAFIILSIIAIFGIIMINQHSDKGFLSKEFSIEGRWLSVGDYGFGQAQPGEIVIFDNYRCNLYSPGDTYEIEKDGSSYYLTTDTFGDKTVFKMTIIDDDNIQLDFDGSVTELQRIE